MGLEDDGPNVKKEGIVVYQHINAPTDSLWTRKIPEWGSLWLNGQKEEEHEKVGSSSASTIICR